jgi:tetratricopeptide (TPR) repeat protein
MAKKNSQQDAEVIIDVEQSISKVEAYFNENQKSITAIIIGLFVIVGGYFAYAKFYQEPRENEALVEIFPAQRYFESDSLRLAVNGDGLNLGFVDVADQYSGTKTGNLASYYAGICYLNMGDYQNAIQYLDDFNSSDPILSVIAKGSIGDAFMEIDQPKEALDYYKAAVSGKENSLVVPFYLKKAAVLAENQGEWKDALNYFGRLKSDFSESQYAIEVDKYIARIETKSGK